MIYAPDGVYPENKNVFSVGCSFTEGTGVKRENNFTSELAKKLKYNPRNYSASGHSNQYIFIIYHKLYHINL